MWVAHLGQPLVVKVGESQQLLLSGSGRILGLDPLTGEKSGL